MGIPDDLKQSIFGEFYRGTESSQMGPGGLDLGLSIVDRLARLLDHSIEVSSRLGRGSRFSISVPAVAAHDDNRDSVRPLETIEHPGHGRTVCVIDDDPVALEGMIGTLRNWGFEAVCAKSEDEAVRALKERGRGLDLIISDYHLGSDRNGIQVIERLRKSVGTQVPAFLVSGDTAPDRQREARERGYILLHKPVLPITLRAIISRLLRHCDDLEHTAEFRSEKK